MLIHDTRFEELAKAPVKETDVEVARQILDTYGYIDDSLIWTSSDSLMKVTILLVGNGFLVMVIPLTLWWHQPCFHMSTPKVGFSILIC